MKVAIVTLALFAYVHGDATSDCKGAATSCSNFFELCGAGCKGGWGAGCGGSPGAWSSSTKCDCSNWGGLRAPKVEQTDDVFLKQAYDLHNTLRAKHSAPALKVDSKAESFAKSWCQNLANKDSMYHSSGSGFGENLYYSSGITEAVRSAWILEVTLGADAVQAWYDEISDYDFSNPGFSGGTGHFTQVVWKSSTGVGCGRAKSSSGNTYVCCNYSPPGNMMGDFENNVLKN